MPKPAKKYPVIELFGPVIQGEGSQAGQQTMFIRFGGCDYRCVKCDSMHAVEPQAIAKHATYMDADEIMDKLWTVREQTGVQWVTFSGGNPAMHQLMPLVAALNESGWFINVETQGTLWQDWMHSVHLLTISPKSFGMGEKFESAKFRKILQKRADNPVCIKVVVGSAQDLEFALQIEGEVNDAYNELYGTIDAIQLPWVAYYLSLLNPYPPVLDEDLNLVDSPTVTTGKLMAPPGINLLADSLLKNYRSLSEEVLLDPRLKNWRFLPQLHVLVYGNESER